MSFFGSLFMFDFFFGRVDFWLARGNERSSVSDNFFAVISVSGYHNYLFVHFHYLSLFHWNH